MSDPTDNDTLEDMGNVEEQKQNSSSKNISKDVEDSKEDAEVDKVTDDKQFDKVTDNKQFENDFEKNKQEISLLMNAFDTHSHLKKALTAVQLWALILDSKCAVQKIVRPLTPILRQMKVHKKLDSPLPNPKNLTPEDTRQLRKLWEKGDFTPAPKGLEALTSIKERMKCAS